jgi:hypothetical protein
MLNRNKRILVAVDNSKASMRAVNYVANIIAGMRDFTVCLLHVPGPLPPELREFGRSEDPRGKRNWRRNSRTNAGNGFKGLKQKPCRY